VERLYMMSQEDDLIARVAGELVGDGVAPGRIRVFTMHPARMPELPVKVLRYRSPVANLAYGGVVGALLGAAIGLALMLSGYIILATLLMIIVVIAAAGAVAGSWFGRGVSEELYRLDGVLRRGEVVMAVDVEKARLAELERAIKSSHPEVAVLGTDTEGTPPFP
jgi:hypothetical protein